MQGNTHLHSRYRPHTTASMARSIPKGYKGCTNVLRTYVHVYQWYVPWYTYSAHVHTSKTT
jgi:hypothetical protein